MLERSYSTHEVKDIRYAFQVAHNIKGMKLAKAKAFLEDVLQFKQAVTFTKYTGGISRHAQGKLRKAPGDKCCWPQKATKIILDLLKNAEANAEMKGLDVDLLKISHIQCNRAPMQRRRTYRAHGRINPFMSNPTHIEVILSEEEAPVKKAEEEEGKKLKLNKRQQARLRIKAGGGVSA